VGEQRIKAAYRWKKKHPEEFRRIVAAWEKFFGLEKFDESTGVRCHVGASRSLKGPVQRVTELRYKQQAIFQGGNPELLAQYEQLAARHRDPQPSRATRRRKKLPHNGLHLNSRVCPSITERASLRASCALTRVTCAGSWMSWGSEIKADTSSRVEIPTRR
jgi:hypothetical protein